MLFDRLQKFVRIDEHWRKYREVFDSDQEFFEHLAEDSGSIDLLILDYKRQRWGKRHEESFAKGVCTLEKKLNRRSRKVDERLLVLCGWMDTDGGLRGQCAYCGIPLDLDEVTIDHLVPKSRGGTERIDNLVSACVDCNLQKGDRSVADFLASSGLDAKQVVEIEAEIESAITFRASAGAPWMFRLSGTQQDRLGVSSGHQIVEECDS